jgi:hypothetical protein
MITTRFFGGGASSVAINLVGGSIADIWKGPKGKLTLPGSTQLALDLLDPAYRLRWSAPRLLVLAEGNKR